MTDKLKGDAAPWHEQIDNSQTMRPNLYRRSQYVTMRDGIKIAVDIYLPNQRQGERLPTLFHQTRYYRRMSVQRPLDLWTTWRDDMQQMIRTMVANGYAFVNIDVRGTGASFGSRQMEWSPDEVRDAGEIMDWIIAQPWSNGMIGLTGVSYTGVSAEMSIANHRPAVKAANVQFSLFDAYTDVLAPGGILNTSFLQKWSLLTKHLDHDDLATFLKEHMGFWVASIVKGVAAVDADKSGELLQSALEEHRVNYDVFDAARQLICSDDCTDAGVFVEFFSPHAHLAAVKEADVPIYSWSGWYDGAYPMSAVNRFLNVSTPGSRLILGPWDHGARQNPDPFSPDQQSKFDRRAEILRFFDHYLKDGAGKGEVGPAVRYFTMGEETWKQADTWPPPDFEPLPLYLGDYRRLIPQQRPDSEGYDRYRIDDAASSGKFSRWYSQANIAQDRIGYPDRALQDVRLLVYQSAPLPQALEVTGHPLVTLYLRADAADLQLFVYLEDVTPQGQVHYITEGLFRASHRKIGQGTPPYVSPVPFHSFLREDMTPLIPGETTELIFDLQPVSYLFSTGHAIRLAIAGADQDNFAPLPHAATSIELVHGPKQASHIMLPAKWR